MRNLNPGSRVWTALVEVKTGRNKLEAEQLENYLEVARRHGLQALLTISNQTSVADGVHPTKIDKRKLKYVALHHMAWNEVLSRAVVEKEHRGVADPDQAYMLDELIRYLEHPRSGALEFEDMGASWVPVRNAVADGTLRSNNPEAADVAHSSSFCDTWSALMINRSAARLRTWGAAPPWRRHTTEPGSASRLQRPPWTICPLHLTTGSGSKAHRASL
jgi:hypothetical protein